MNYLLSGREPAKALRYFEDISAIPRGSGNEEEISAYLVNFAKQHKLEVYHDNAMNVYIKKPGSKGCENAETLILQGHTDIVCEKNRGVNHDFAKDPIKLVVDGNILRADGTTLGADNGVAVAWMMAVLTDDTLVHPPLECIFTACEEIGLIGAHNLEFKRITGRRMVNLDCGPEGQFCCGSAGGVVTDINLNLPREKASGTQIGVNIRGLAGGHSGGLIHKYLGNANVIMAKILMDVAAKVDCKVMEISGGDKDNAIPRECDAVILVDNADKAMEIIKKAEAEIKSQLMPEDLAFYVETSQSDANNVDAFTIDASAKLLSLMTIVPSGPALRDMTMDARVVASQNFASAHTNKAGVKFVVSIRSSNDAYRKDMMHRLETLAKFAGGTVHHHDDYESWEIEKHSKIRDAILECYTKVTGKQGTVVATHGGLECGIFQKGLPGIDMVTMCCNSSGAHSPDECMELDSFERCYKLLVALLEQLAK